MYHFDPLLTDSGTFGGSLKRKLVIGSAIAHVVLFIILAILPGRARSIEEPSLPIQLVLTAPAPKIAEFIPPAPAPKPPPQPKKLEPPKVQEPEPLPVPEPPPAPRAEIKPAPAPAPAPAPPKPKPVVQTNVFGGVAEGPPVVTGKNSRTVIAAFGDQVAPPSGATARRGRVAEVGFDTAPAAPAAPRRAGMGGVKIAAFDAQAAAAPAPAAPKRERPVSRLDAEVEILSKPKPAYTDEARRLRIEGDVVLRVTFQANGRLVVQGVVDGLGHGLDEAAIEAAKKIEFNPARRDGQPVDHTANLRVVFRLA
jgi:TonB family protein